jgi:hypothetical protein
MGTRSPVGSVPEPAIGRERTNTIRTVERRACIALVKRLAMEPPKKPPKRPAATGRTTSCSGSIIPEVRRMVPQ